MKMVMIINVATAFFALAISNTPFALETDPVYILQALSLKDPYEYIVTETG